MVRSQRISQSSRGDDPLQLIAAIQPPCLYADPVAIIKHGAADVLAGPAALNLIAIAPIQPVLGARGSEEVLREPGVLSGLAPASVA
jgi:hypothetical protein